MTTDTEIPTHELDYPDLEGSLAGIEDILPIALENLAAIPDNLGSAFDYARQRLGFRTALRRPPTAIVEALRSIVELGVALFQRGSFGPDTIVTLTIGGASIDVAGGSSHYDSAPRWADAVGAAMSLRDEAALARLCEFDLRSFQGNYADYFNTYARAVIAWVNERDDVDALLEQMATAASSTKKFPERGRRLGVPLANLARAVVCGDEAAFNQHLAEGLTWYRTLHSRAPDKHEAALVVPLQFLGWAARAHDLGLACRVRSDYLPAWLVSSAARDDQ